MSASLPISREQIERQAALWTARLENGDLPMAQRAELEAWLQADPEHGYVLSRYRELHAGLAAQVPVLLDAGEVQAVVARAARWYRIRRATSPALAAAAALVLGAVVWWMLPTHLETSSRERRAVVLDDGSRVELNALTSLEVSFGRSLRRVKLAHGEALFQVTRDPARPFVVETPRGTVRVTGTVFNVRETDAVAVEVTLLEGSVQLTATGQPGRPIVLVPNEQGVIRDEAIAKQTLTPDEAQNLTAWRTGQVAFTAAPLREALARFAPYHQGRITVDDAAATLSVGGRYSLDDLEGFLAALEQALPVHVLRGESDRIRIVARDRVGK